MNQKPGVMIYFDILPAIRSMSNADKGILFEAILEYGLHRQRIPLTKKTEVLWPLIQQRVDRDELQYNKAVVKRAYAAYVRWAKQNGEEPLDFTAWQEKKGYPLMSDSYEPTAGYFFKEDA